MTEFKKSIRKHVTPREPSRTVHWSLIGCFTLPHGTKPPSRLPPMPFCSPPSLSHNPLHAVTRIYQHELQFPIPQVPRLLPTIQNCPVRQEPSHKDAGLPKSAPQSRPVFPWWFLGLSKGSRSLSAIHFPSCLSRTSLPNQSLGRSGLRIKQCRRLSACSVWW